VKTNKVEGGSDQTGQQNQRLLVKGFFSYKKIVGQKEQSN
jgi:hypothetical protein